jgi:hypothetical protein
VKITEHPLTAWDRIHAYAKPAWIYRGQRHPDWDLATSLERCCEREAVGADDRHRFEKELRRDFRRVYHQYAQHIPAAESVMEWISLMQHHGAPTRLLDFTYSVYVAAYFALEAADNDCVVWAVNAPWALKQSVSALVSAGKQRAQELQAPTQEGHESVARELLFEEPFAPCAVPLTPFRQNERLRTQRGTFLVPGDVSVAFMDNLRALPDHDQPANVLKILIPKGLRPVALAQLYAMNISRTSLFPGLDGYAQSLGVFHPSFRPASW